jgi:hypothetical protein
MVHHRLRDTRPCTGRLQLVHRLAGLLLQQLHHGRLIRLAQGPRQGLAGPALGIVPTEQPRMRLRRQQQAPVGAEQVVQGG